MAIFTKQYSGEYGKYYEFKAEATESDVSIANNTSKVTVNIYVRRTNVSSAGAYNLNGTPWSITIDGTTSNGSSTWDTRNSSDWKWLGSASKVITHNTDGSKEITISASHTGNSATGNSKMGDASGSGKFTLTKIARYATISQSLNSKTETSIKMNWSSDNTIDYIWYSKDNGSTWTGVDVTDGKSGTYTISGLSANKVYNIKTRVRRKDSQLTTETTTALDVTTYDFPKITQVGTTDLTIGNSQTLTLYNPLSRSVTVKMNKDTASGTQLYSGTTTGTSITFTPAASTLYASIPNSQNSKCVYSVVYGNTSTKSTSGTYTYKLKGTEVPVFNAFTYEDVNSKTVNLTGNNQKIVNGYSNVTATISAANKATAQNSATMKRYVMKIGEKSDQKNYSSSADVAITLNSVSGSTVRVTAYDSREKATSKEYNLNSINYTAIKIASLTVERAGGVGTNVTLKFSAKYWNKSFGSVTNKITSCKYRYKLTNASSYTDGTTTLTYSTSGENITGSISIKGDLGADGFNTSNSFDIQLIISDELTTVYGNVLLGSGTPAIAIYKRNVAIGGKFDSSDDSRLQVFGTVKVKDNGEHIFRIGNGDNSIYWKESNFGDKFKIVPSFSGDGDNNVLKIQSAVGAAGTNPTTYTDILKITGKSGNYYFKGKGYLEKSMYLKNTDTTDNTAFYTERTDTGASVWFGVGSQGTNHGVYSKTLSKWIVHSDGTNVFFDGRGVKTLTARTHSGYGTNNNYLIDVSTLSYWNGAYSSSNQSNLQYCLQGPIQAKPTGLYANESGTTGTVTLSETAANFNYLEIYYSKNGSYYNCTKVSAPNGKKVCLDLSYYDASNKIHQLASKIVSISGTSISVITNNTGLTNLEFNNVNSLYNSNELTIHKVLGYK